MVDWDVMMMGFFQNRTSLLWPLPFFDAMNSRQTQAGPSIGSPTQVRLCWCARTQKRKLQMLQVLLEQPVNCVDKARQQKVAASSMSMGTTYLMIWQHQHLACKYRLPLHSASDWNEVWGIEHTFVKAHAWNSSVAPATSLTTTELESEPLNF